MQLSPNPYCMLEGSPLLHVKEQILPLASTFFLPPFFLLLSLLISSTLPFNVSFEIPPLFLCTFCLLWLPGVDFDVFPGSCLLLLSPLLLASCCSLTKNCDASQIIWGVVVGPVPSFHLSGKNSFL